MSNVPANIRKYRKAHNMTQEQLAEKLNTTRTQIGRYERGEQHPGGKVIFEIMKIFDIHGYELFD